MKIIYNSFLVHNGAKSGKNYKKRKQPIYTSYHYKKDWNNLDLLSKETTSIYNNPAIHINLKDEDQATTGWLISAGPEVRSSTSMNLG